jgi:transcriptional regulator with GAF, ATPase, and Fis domain
LLRSSTQSDLLASSYVETNRTSVVAASIVLALTSVHRMSAGPERDRWNAESDDWTLVVCDDPNLIHDLLAAAATAGVTLRALSRRAFLRTEVPKSTACVGLVRLVGAQPEDQELDAIRDLAAKGVQVLSYGDYAETWPLGARCRALLAGACDVFDSARPDFIDTLRERVVRLSAADAQRRREQEDVRLVFQNLGVVGESDAITRVFRWIARISRLSDLHTLITGETGTGKQLVAEATHRLDPKRRYGSFIVLNCAAVSPGIAESELFGHRRGAFTGADRDRKGLVRAAHGGVLFLDEIGELDLGLQAKLLRVVQEGRVLGLGDDHESVVDVRVLAATNRDLAAMVRDRTFRADLFHRLNILSVAIPPLRERRADIGVLVRHFLAKHRHLGTHGPLDAGDDFVGALAEADLPGNARQVENIVRRAIARKDDDSPLGLSDLPPEIWAHVSDRRSDARMDGAAGAAVGHVRTAGGRQADVSYLTSVLAGNGWNLSRSLASCERSLVEVALQTSRGNQSEAARLLGITPRCVYNKLRKHQLHRPGA